MTTNTHLTNQLAHMNNDAEAATNIPPSLQVLWDAVENVISILNSETRALRDGKTETVSEMIETKISAIRKYGDTLQSIISNGKTIEKIKAEPEHNALFEDLKRRFTSSLEANKRAIMSSQQAVERLSNRILNTARSTVSMQKEGYTKTGSIKPSEKRCVSINVDEVL